ncbi:pleckstrin homology domain-containing family G member 3 isoform X2 [Hemibagrus wyckioides]|uniref:pleckstrin homology domain-containing family G member 3 isoform X2 n=1 Tax=Hemibagrus wyckioides TaxID=337641 RepID=UPI00266DA2C8|nr:pleckstrin homology domain-containing family G member 3 isoform X2 [Hemibagrus wyckioides]
MPEKSHHRHHQVAMGEDSSLSSHDPVLVDYCSLSIEHSDNERPVSIVSTVSSGSSGEGQSSLFSASHCPQSLPSLSTETDINLELSPPEEPNEPPLPLKPASKRPRQDPAAGQFNSNANTAGDITLPPNRDGPSSVATVVMAPNSQPTYVDRVVMEIIETERMYVMDLGSIVEDYLAHIIDTRNLPIKPEQVSSLFGNIEVIYEFNSELLQSLEMCDSDPVAIAYCFVHKSEYFEIYTQYCTNYPNSVATLTECMRNKMLAKFFRDRQASLQHSLPLGAYLLKPVQRILKYHLLLQEIAKHFDPEEEGYDIVEEAIDTMTGVAWYINDMKRKHEHAVRLQEIQSLLINWKGPDLTTYGELVLEGTFHVHRAKNERTLFLFDKMLLITRKRGEHYVYKTHIMCSTLMLIESAKDSLRFSVTHYKHPKQPHTVQAKTVEEKKLWAHHIKRLILENHHAIIPQKAKDAILDMRSDCPVKYRYSPERQNKGEDLLMAGLKERRRSEPFNRVKQNMRTTKETLKHADSMGTLLSDSSQSSLQAAASASTLSSTVDEAETERPVTEESTSGWLSLDWLNVNGLETCQLETPFRRETEEKVETLEKVQTRGREDEDEEIVVKDEQVADFASSVLAAISCWRYKARALLFTRVATNRDGEQAMEENEIVEPKRSRSPSEEDQEENSAECEQDSSEDHRSQVISLTGQEDEEGEEAGQQQSHINPQDKSREGEEIVVGSVQSLSTVQNEIQLENESTQSKANLLDVEDLGEEEDEDEEEEDVSSGTEPRSILPASVLDKASVIAEHFTKSHSRQSSLAADDMFSVGCTSSQTDSRRSSVFSLNAEPLDKEKTQEMNCSSPDPVTFKIVSESLALATPGTHLVTPDQRPQTKPDTLSKKDRMLIHKIKQYYEHAEQQDENFSIKRRESLSYIPPGLVRNLSQQINSIPAEEDAANHRKASKITRPTSWAVFDLPGLEKEKNSEEAMDTETLSIIDREEAMVTPDVVAQATDKDEDFQSSSEMVRVWQDMEVEISGASEEPQEAFEDNMNGTVTNPTQNQKGQESSYMDHGEHLVILEEFDNSKAGNGTSTPSPVGSSLYSDQKLQEIQKIKHVPKPKIVSLRSSSEEDLTLQDMDKMKNKVFHLARQYSQRIKNNRPAVRQRAKVSESNVGHRTLSSVVEDKSPENEMGMQSLTLSLGSCEHTDSSSSLSSCSLGSPQLQSTFRPQALELQSPVYTESFNWPDVRELRSKYSRPNPQLVSINRSCSVPEQILEVGRNNPTARRTCSCSCSSPVCDRMDPHTTSVKDTATTHSTDKGPAGQGVVKMCKSSSLDHMMGPLHLKQQTNHTDISRNYYISGQATLPNENKIIVVERFIKTENNGLATGEEKKEQLYEDQLKCLDSDETCRLRSFEKTENSQHGLVKNLREKFQNLSSCT